MRSPALILPNRCKIGVFVAGFPPKFAKSRGRTAPPVLPVGATGTTAQGRAGSTAGAAGTTGQGRKSPFSSFFAWHFDRCLRCVRAGVPRRQQASATITLRRRFLDTQPFPDRKFENIDRKTKGITCITLLTPNLPFAYLSYKTSLSCIASFALVSLRV